MVAKSMTQAGARRGPKVLALSYLAVFVVLIVLAAAVSFLGNPHAGDPVVVTDLRGPSFTRPSISAASSAAPVQQKSRSVSSSATSAGSPASPQITQKIYSGGALVADPALIENTPSGPLPRIADNGATPMQAYAPATTSDSRPRIAIVIGGLGISATRTEAALSGLPVGVTLAFAPYAADAQHWVALARKQGHEVLLEIPMEPYDFPDSDPGPHTLRSGVGEDANTERLVWALTRFSGYAGVTNLLGGRFMADASSLEPMLTYLARRGLMFYDNGAAHSAAPDVASRVGLSFLQSGSTIDKIQTAVEIDRRLSALEMEARDHGSAAGSGQIYPITIERVRNWAQGLAGRGFVLGPASAIVSQSK